MKLISMKKNLTLFFVALSCFSLQAQETPDTATLKRNYPSVLGQSALERRSDSTWLYLLQRPRVSKRFENKRFCDHLFTEVGGGVNAFVTRSTSSYLMKPGAQATAAIGDWITPEHGVRLGLMGGQYKFSNTDYTVAGVSLDYLMNLSALAAPAYPKARPVEFYGVAGIDLLASHTNSENIRSDLRGIKLGWGAHAGLRAQFHLSDYTYLYLEPRIGLTDDGALHIETGRGYRPYAALLAGAGYRFSPTRALRPNRFDQDASFLNATFFSVQGGVSRMLRPSGDFLTNPGYRLSGSIGKWFTPVHGLRLTAQVAWNENVAPGAKHNFKAISAGADYLLNLHNAFGGYNPNRWFWINGVAGFNLNCSNGEGQRPITLGLGGGLQANVRLAKGVSLFVEPRADLYDGRYAAGFTTAKEKDVVLSVLGGLSFQQGLNTKEQRGSNDNFKNETFWDHLEVQAGLGAVAPLASLSPGVILDQMYPKAFVGVGKWLSPIAGVRVWGEAGLLHSNFTTADGLRLARHKFVNLGLDYMWNVTNTFHGYDESRRTEIISTFGVNASRLNHKSIKWGLNASFRGVWHLNRMWGLFLEPQLRLYKKDYITPTTPGVRADLVGAMLAGLQVRAFGYNPETDRGTFDIDGRHSFITLGAGPATNVYGVRNLDNWGSIARIGVGNWFSPVAAWRATLSGMANKTVNYKYAKGIIGADLMVDLNAATYGNNPDRVVALRAIGGFGLGVDYRSGIGKAKFVPDLHAGMQLGFRIVPAVELYLEPMMLCQLKRPSGINNNVGRLQPQAYAGLNYLFGGSKETSRKELAAPSKKQFVSAAVGTGISTQNITMPGYFEERLTVTTDITYGRWMTASSGFRAGLANSRMKFNKDISRNLTSVHLDYLLDFRSFTAEAAPDERVFSLYGIAGVMGGACYGDNFDTRWGVGAEAGLQFDVKAAPAFHIFAEPVLQIYNSHLGNHYHAFEADAKLMLGAKYCF